MRERLDIARNPARQAAGAAAAAQDHGPHLAADGPHQPVDEGNDIVGDKAVCERGDPADHITRERPHFIDDPARERLHPAHDRLGQGGRITDRLTGDRDDAMHGGGGDGDGRRHRGGRLVGDGARGLGGTVRVPDTSATVDAPSR